MRTVVYLATGCRGLKCTSKAVIARVDSLETLGQLAQVLDVLFGIDAVFFGPHEGLLWCLTKEYRIRNFAKMDSLLLNKS